MCKRYRIVQYGKLQQEEKLTYLIKKNKPFISFTNMLDARRGALLFVLGILLNSSVYSAYAKEQYLDLRLQYWKGMGISPVKAPVSFEWSGKYKGESIYDAKGRVELIFEYKENGKKKKKYYSFCRKGKEVILGFVKGDREGIAIPVYECGMGGCYKGVEAAISILGKPRKSSDIGTKSKVKCLNDGGHPCVSYTEYRVYFNILKKNNHLYPYVNVCMNGQNSRCGEPRIDGEVPRYGIASLPKCDEPEQKDVSGVSALSSQGRRGAAKVYNTSGPAVLPQKSSSDRGANQLSGRKQKKEAEGQLARNNITIVLIGENDKPVKSGLLSVRKGKCSGNLSAKYKNITEGKWLFSVNDLPRSGVYCVAYKRSENKSPVCYTGYRVEGDHILTIRKPFGSCTGELKFSVKVGDQRQRLGNVELDILSKKLPNVELHTGGYLIAKKATKQDVESWLQPYFEGLGSCRMEGGICFFSAKRRNYIMKVRVKLMDKGRNKRTADCLPRLKINGYDCGRMNLDPNTYEYWIALPRKECNTVLFKKEGNNVRITFDKPDGDYPDAKSCRLVQPIGSLRWEYLLGRVPLNVEVLQSRSRLCVFHAIASPRNMESDALRYARKMHLRVSNYIHEKLPNSPEGVSEYIWTKDGWDKVSKVTTRKLKRYQSGTKSINNLSFDIKGCVSSILLATPRDKKYEEYGEANSIDMQIIGHADNNNSAESAVVKIDLSSDEKSWIKYYGPAIDKVIENMQQK